MALEKFYPSDRDTWTWHPAQLHHVDQIVALAQSHFENEVNAVFTTDPLLFAKHICVACVEQRYNPLHCQLIVAVSNNRVIAYAWLNRGVYMTYAPEEVAEAAFAHIDLTLPIKTRVTLMAQILVQWELWANICSIPVLVSTTIREDQRGFLRLHEEAGYSIRGSFAFKRLV